MNKKLLSVIGSAALLSSMLSLGLAQTADTPAAAPAAAPAAPPPVAPAAAPAAPVVTPPPANAPVETSEAKPATASKKSGGKLAAKLARVTAAVGLSADQQTQVMAIYKEEEKQIKAVKADKTLSKDQQTTKITAIRDAADDKIVALLTPDQQKKYTEYKHHKA